MTNTYDIFVDFNINNHVVLKVKQHDDLSRIICITCTTDGDIVNLNSSDCTCDIKMLLPNGARLREPANINDDGIVIYELTKDVLSEHGKAFFEVVLSNSETNKQLSSMPVTLIIEPSVF